MIKKAFFTLYLFACSIFFLCAQINTDRVMIIGRNALYYEDYVLSIQYFNQVIQAKPYLAEPYFYRAIAKLCLDDSKGAEDDFTLALQRNPFLSEAYQYRGDARLYTENYKEAISDYNKMFEYSPDNKYALRNSAIANIQIKNYDEAEKSLNSLIKLYPKFAEAYTIQGSMLIEKGDTIKAIDSYNKAIDIDKYYAPSYSVRALAYYAIKKYDEALADLDESIKLDPAITGNYINRGLIKYNKNDLRGAMADYDQVIEKEADNLIAHFNRGLLRAQVGDDNRAISDFDFVIQHEPNNYIAYMNRSMLKQNISDYRGALADLNIVLEQYPEFYQGYYMRSELKRKINDMKSAEKDYLYARNEEKKAQAKILTEKGDIDKSKPKDSKTREESDKTIDKFNLLVVADAADQQKSKYKNENRGRVQDKQVRIESEPRFVVSYYQKSEDPKSYIYDNSEINAINKQSFLSRRLLITNKEEALTEKQIGIHFASIDEYSRLIANSPQNAKLYFARSLDYMLVKNFASAIEDLEKAVELNPKFTLAYFNLAVVYTKQFEFKEHMPETGLSSGISSDDLAQLQANKKEDALNPSIKLPSASLIKDKDAEDKLKEYHKILQNYNKVIELNPNFIYAYYNKAEIRTMLRDYRASILDYNEAIKKESNFAEAYFNRGLSRLQLGEKDKGLADLRKAGELGIVSAYNIIKRMSE